MDKSRVIIRSVKEQSLDEVIAQVLAFCGAPSLVKPGARVVLKPNLCTERVDMIPVANTSYALLESVVKHLLDLGAAITIGESDGARYTVEQAYESNGVYKLAQKYGVKAVNFTRDEQVWVDNGTLGKWNFGRTFLEADLFITLPVIKTHATTVFTGALKNQWGCVPRYDRLIWHKYLSRLLSDIAVLVPPAITIMDGITGMQGRGPINGYAINAGVVLGGTDLVAVDATSMRLVGLDPYASDHVKLASQRGIGRIAEEDIEIDGDFDKLRIQIEPAKMDWAIRLLNLFSRSEFITKNLIMNERAFYPVRRLVIIMRKLIG
ncbi:MAG: DUF362 domain-containing protein [Candidatus Krumholzibacteriota bacterium]|nr:DUF362 domain-containing protein [Candidatus Krumholzibacteriota bacterium]